MNSVIFGFSRTQPLSLPQGQGDAASFQRHVRDTGDKFIAKTAEVPHFIDRPTTWTFFSLSNLYANKNAGFRFSRGHRYATGGEEIRVPLPDHSSAVRPSRRNRQRSIEA